MSENRFDGKIEEYIPAIRRIANKFAQGRASGLEEDLLQEGAIGILNAPLYEGDDLERRRRYYLYHARNAMVDFMRRYVEPRAVHRAKVALGAVEAECGAKSRAQMLGVTLARYERLRVLATAGCIPLEEGDDISAGLADIEHRDALLSLFAPRVIDALKERERRILVWRSEGLFQGEIAKILNVTESRVTQLLGEMRKKIKSKQNKK